MVHLTRALREFFTSHPTLARAMRDRLDRGWTSDPKKHALLASWIKAYRGGDSQYIDFYGPGGSMTTVPYFQVLEWDGNDALPVDVRGKAVFVGVAETPQPDEKDDYATPFAYVSGVEIAATVFSNLLEGREIRSLQIGRAGLLLCGVLVAIVLYCFLHSHRAAVWLPLWTACLGGGYCSAS